MSDTYICRRVARRRVYPNVPTSFSHSIGPWTWPWAAAATPTEDWRVGGRYAWSLVGEARYDEGEGGDLMMEHIVSEDECLEQKCALYLDERKHAQQ